MATPNQQSQRNNMAPSLLPPPPFNAMMSTAFHMQAMQQEHQRYNMLRSNLSAEIVRLKNLLKSSTKENESLEETAKALKELVDCKQDEVDTLKDAEFELKESQRELQKQVETLTRELQKCKKETKKSLKSTKQTLKESQKRTRELEKIVTKKRAREEQLMAVNVVPGQPRKKHVPKPDSLHEIKWNARFQELVQFKQQHGHCNVSKNAHPDHKDLAVWVIVQRMEHKLVREGKYSTLRSERIQKLMSIGFEWTLAKTKALTFTERVEQLRFYKEQHGHVNVPQKCKHAPAGLGEFVLSARKMYKATTRGLSRPGGERTLTDEEIAALEELGFQWSLRNRQSKKQPQF